MKAKVKKKLAKPKKKPKNHTVLEMDGHIYVVEYKGPKVVSKEEIDGKVVLKLLLKVISDHCRYLLNEV